MSGDTLNVYLEINGDADDAATYRPYFQLWGMSPAGEEVAGMPRLAVL